MRNLFAQPVALIACTCKDAWILTPVAHFGSVNFTRLAVGRLPDDGRARGKGVGDTWT
jgi:hypothetical protein